MSWAAHSLRKGSLSTYEYPEPPKKKRCSSIACNNIAGTGIELNTVPEKTNTICFIRQSPQYYPVVIPLLIHKHSYTVAKLPTDNPL